MIDTLVNLSWRLYLAIPLMALGATLALQAARRGRPALLCTVRGDPAQLVTLMQCFRATVIGLAMVGIGAAWIWHLTWLLIVSLAIAAGESLETALIIFAVRHGAQLQVGPSRVRGRLASKGDSLQAHPRQIRAGQARQQRRQSLRTPPVASGS